MKERQFIKPEADIIVFLINDIITDSEGWWDGEDWWGDDHDVGGTTGPEVP